MKPKGSGLIPFGNEVEHGVRTGRFPAMFQGSADHGRLAPKGWYESAWRAYARVNHPIPQAYAGSMAGPRGPGGP